MEMHMDNNRMAEHTLWYQNPALNFNESLPLGNGRIGACVYGGIGRERISLNEDTLWSGYPKEIVKENFPEVYQKASQLMNAGRVSEAQTLLEGKFGDYLVQVYLPLGSLQIEMAHGEEAAGYERKLQLDNAVHTVTYRIGDTIYTRESFVSHDAQVLAVHMTCSRPAGISLAAWLESQLKCERRRVGEEEWKDVRVIGGNERSDRNEQTGGSVSGRLSSGVSGEAVGLEGHAPECVAGYGDHYRSPDHQVYSDDPAHRGIGFSAMLSVRAAGGEVRYEGAKAIVTGADEVTIYVAARTAFEKWNRHPSDSGVDYRGLCLADLKRVWERPYPEVLQEHITAHQELYNRCEISLGSSSNSSLATDRRMELLDEGEEDNALYTLLFNYGRYLAIASSREGTQPANLQGIWNEKLLPPWNSNYTLNINTEMNYWPMLACGLRECYEPLIRMAGELAESGSLTAKTYYGLDGWVCHHSSDIWRLTHPGTNRLPGNAQWGFWNMSSGWISVMLWNYYRYTGDKEYLANIYPVMEGAARFYRQPLSEQDGQLVLSPSTSPENNYIQDGEEHAVDCSTAMTQEILFDLFLAVAEAQNILGKREGGERLSKAAASQECAGCMSKSAEFCDYDYAELAARLKKPQIQSDGLLCEWDKEHEVWDPHHRHVSHLYGLFPSDQFDEAQKEAAKKVLEQRGDGGTGWSLAWKINLWARLRDGEHALMLLKNQLNLVPSVGEKANKPDGSGFSGGSYPNLMCAHPPFQIDGNFGAASGIIEMLVQTDRNGEPILLPALPKSWKEGRVTGICLPGGKTISFEWADGKVRKIW